MNNRRLAQLGKDIDLGIEQVERGEYTELTVSELPQLVEVINAEGRQRHAKRLFRDQEFVFRINGDTV